MNHRMAVGFCKVQRNKKSMHFFSILVPGMGAFDHKSIINGGAFDRQSCPRGGEFDHKNFKSSNARGDAWGNL